MTLPPLALNTFLKLCGQLPTQASPQDLKDDTVLILPRVDVRMIFLIRKGISSPQRALCFDRFLTASEISDIICELTPLSHAANLKSVELYIDDTTDFTEYDIITLPAYRFNDESFNTLRTQLSHDRWHQILIPLSVLPARPLEGLYSFPREHASHELRNELDPISDAQRFALLQELTIAEDGFVYVTSIPYSYGIVTSFKKTSDETSSTLRTLAPYQYPQKVSESWIWPLHLSEAEIFHREEIECSASLNQENGVLVSRFEAADSINLSDALYVWAAGTTTWKKLIRDGIWVNGSCDSLGESELRNSLATFHPVNWVKISHEEPFVEHSMPVLATYRLIKNDSFPSLKGKRYFYWRSGSAFLEMLGKFPEIRSAYHFSGPGNTRETLLKYLPQERCFVALNHSDWKHMVVYDETVTEDAVLASHEGSLR